MERRDPDPAAPSAEATGEVAPPTAQEYRVEALSALTGLSVRNIREYQAAGLLPGPRKVGRHAFYGEEHLVRLQLIDRLQQRGYANAGIRDLLEAWATGQSLDQVLGLDTVVSEPWTTETPTVMTSGELTALVGAELTPESLERLGALGVVSPRDAGGFDVRSPSLLVAARDLIDSGVPLATVLDVAALVRAELDSPADRLIGMVWDHVFPQGEDAALPVGAELQLVTRRIARLRPHAMRTVDTFFAEAVLRAIGRRYREVTDRVVAADKSAAGKSSEDGPE